MNLKIVDEAFGRSRLVGLNYTDIVAVKVDVGVLHRQLVRGDHNEATGAVNRVELPRRLLLFLLFLFDLLLLPLFHLPTLARF